MKITLNGIQINYTERGLPQGLPVVFLHGFPFNHTTWEPQMKALPNNIRAISFDIRGHGESDVAEGQYTIELFVDDLIALLDHLVIEKAVVCGLSMGGYIALRGIERHPERFRALILCDTRSEPDPDEAKIKRSATIRAIRKDGVPTFAGAFLKAVFAERSFQAAPQAVEAVRTAIIANSPVGICGTAIALAARTDTTRSLPAINVPTLILVGELDALTPPAASRTMHEAIAGSELHIIPHAAHMSNLENSPEFNKHLLTFLNRIRDRS
jgi:3-oxoadipate enol-lactonase